MKRAERDSSKTIGAETDNAMTISIANEANAFSAGDNSTCSNRGSRKDECSDDIAAAKNRVGLTQLICHRGKQGEELLYLWRFWAHGLPLQKQKKRKDRAGKKSRV